MRYIVTSFYGDIMSGILEDEDSLEEYMQDELDGNDSYHVERLTVIELGDEVKFTVQPAKITLRSASVDIPAPMPGESVTDYAARITAS